MLLKVIKEDSEEIIEIAEFTLSSRSIFAVKSDGSIYHIELDDDIFYLII